MTEPAYGGVDLASADALVVGASRGLGLALAASLASGTHEVAAQAGTPRRLFVTHRGATAPDALQALAEASHSEIVPIPCDVTVDDQVAALGSALADHGAELLAVIHAAGILHETGVAPEKALGQLRREALQRVFEVNAFAPLLVAKEVLRFVPRNTPSHLAALSAMVGSIGDNRIGGWYAYRSSKAALNQLLRTLAIECRRTHPGLCVTSIHPGTTDTDLSKPFQGNVPEGKLYRPEDSAARILSVVLTGKPNDSGRFMNWDGRTLPW